MSYLRLQISQRVFSQSAYLREGSERIRRQNACFLASDKGGRRWEYVKHSSSEMGGSMRPNSDTNGKSANTALALHHEYERQYLLDAVIWLNAFRLEDPGFIPDDWDELTIEV